MKKLMLRWNIDTLWHLIIIFFVFSITGSSSIFIGRPILKIMGLTLKNVDPFLYYPFFVFLSFVFYQVFLVLYGWIFGQFNFFWNMEKKMLKRLGIVV
ncbi:diacylglyceryl transferase [Tenacibaculum sp.]|nr:diacylglyceryl transferase [Tenacibaculum sp.]